MIEPIVRHLDVGWGPDGLLDLAGRCDALVIVDVLRFTTAVDVAVSRGAEVFPYRWHDGTEADYAEKVGAELAVRGLEVDDGHPWSLSPVALERIPPGTRLVLPSPNGAALAFAARDAGVATVVAACLRNASSVGAWVARRAESVGVLAAGERWGGAAGPLRPAVEDWLGAGAVVAAAGDRSVRAPDALAAAGSFAAARHDLVPALLRSASGRELEGRGWADDVLAAAAHDVSRTVPVLVDDRFVDGSGRPPGMGE